MRISGGLLWWAAIVGSALTTGVQAQDAKQSLLDSLRSVYQTAGVDGVGTLIDQRPLATASDTSVFTKALGEFSASMYSEGNRKDATAILERARTRLPRRLGIHLLLGQFYWYDENRRECIRSFQTALTLDSTESLARQYMDMLTFMPDGFVVPESLVTTHLLVRPLRPSDVALDYRAVMESRNHIRGVFGPDDDWPKDSLTEDADLNALKNHEAEHRRRSAFTFTVMNHDETECLGCVYILPVHLNEFDAQVYMWTTKRAFDAGWDAELFGAVKRWISEKWPLERVAYPGRDIDWATWGKYEEY